MSARLSRPSSSSHNRKTAEPNPLRRSGLMKCRFLIRVSCILILVASAFASVNVTAPSNGAVLGSPVNYVASATTGCSKGVASMGVYVDNQLVHVVNGKSLNTNVTMTPGSHNTVVEE